MSNSKKAITDKLPYISFALLIIGILFFNHILELRAEEGKRAMVTFETMKSGNMLVPQFNGHDYYNKPPFYNWIMAAFFTLFGSIKESIVRLPGVLSYLATALLVFQITRKYINKNTALLAAGISLTLSDILFYGSINAGEIDLFYMLLTVAQMFAIFHFFQQSKWWQLFLISYSLMAIGALTKGIPSLAFQAITLLAYFIYKKQFRKLFSISHFVSMAIAFGLVIGYFYVYSFYGDAVGYLLNTFKQASQRSANAYTFSEIALNLLSFPFKFLQHMLPWAISLLLLFYKPIRQSIFKNELTAFLVIFILSNIPIYWSAPELRIRYTYMFFPILSIIFAHLLVKGHELGTKLNLIFGYLFRYVFIVGGIALLASPFFGNFLSVAQMIIAFVIGLLLIAIFILSKKETHMLNIFHFTVFVLAIARIGFNLIGLPITKEKRFHYEEKTLGMINIVGDQPISYFGYMYDMHPKLHFFNHTFYEQTLLSPDDYPNDFPYYEAMHRDQVLGVTDQIKSGQYYLLYDHLFDENRFEALDTIPKISGGRTLLFCRAK